MYPDKDRPQAEENSAGERHGQEGMTMELPLFPLDVVLFPGMVLPLHIFEPRYREMISRCAENQEQFGVVLNGGEGEAAVVDRPHAVGTAARVSRVEHLEDGRMNITAIGMQRFRILELDRSRSYLSATVCQYPVIDGGTRLAMEKARRVVPQVLEYVELLSQASKTKLRLDRLPEDPKRLAILVAIALQVNNEEKQSLLELAGVPEMLGLESRLLSWETMLLRHMMATQSDIEEMSIGASGYIFPN